MCRNKDHGVAEDYEDDIDDVDVDGDGDGDGDDDGVMQEW